MNGIEEKVRLFEDEVGEMRNAFFVYEGGKLIGGYRAVDDSLSFIKVDIVSISRLDLHFYIDGKKKNLWLTQTEFQYLDLLDKNRPNVVSEAEFHEKIRFEKQANSLPRQYIHWIREKFEKLGIIDSILTVYGKGYRLL